MGRKPEADIGNIPDIPFHEVTWVPAPHLAIDLRKVWPKSIAAKK
jgi:hypothetical protein